MEIRRHLGTPADQVAGAQSALLFAVKLKEAGMTALDLVCIVAVTATDMAIYVIRGLEPIIAFRQTCDLSIFPTDLIFTGKL